MNRSRLMTIFIIAASLIYSFWGCFCGLNVYDEGIIVYGADRVLHGDIIYRDFWTVYPPGEFWLLAIIFKLFGMGLGAERILSALVHALVAVMVYLVSRKFISLKVSVIPWLLSLLWINTYGFASPAPTALLFALVSTFFLISYMKEAKNPDLYLCGLFSAIVLIFRHDLGFLGALGQSVILSAYIITVKKERPGPKIVIYLAGYFTVFMPFAAYLLISVPFNDLFADLIKFPIMTYPHVRSLAYPSPVPNPAQIFSQATTKVEYLRQVMLRLDYYFPFLIYLTALIRILKSFKKHQQEEELYFRRWVISIFLVMGLLFYIQGLVRAHLTHLRPTYFPAIFLLSYFIEDALRPPKRRVFILISLVFVVAMAWIPFSEKTGGIAALRKEAIYFNIERAKGIVWDKRGESYQELVLFLQKNIPQGERIFVGNSRHDRIFSNDVMLYFLSGRQSALKYHELVPGTADTALVQREMISDLERHKVRYLVLFDNEVIEPNASGKGTGVVLLDDYIRSNFVYLKTFGQYAVWIRRLK